MINKSWFKLELYTATPGELTEYIKGSIQKTNNYKSIIRRRLVLSNCYNRGSRIDISEGTTKYIVIDCVDCDGSVFNLDGYTATVLLKFNDNSEIKKEYKISDNTISFTIDPEDTIDKKSGEYEVRIYQNKDIYRVIKGDIGIQSSIRPFLYANEEV